MSVGFSLPGQKKLIMVLGTGRCGTMSMSKALNSQRNTSVTHEHRPVLPWQPNKRMLRAKMDAILSGRHDNVGDAAFYYLPYVPMILSSHLNVKFVCLQRNREATVQSYLKWTRGRNHWMSHDGQKWKLDPRFDQCYPKFQIASKREALYKYWDQYYQTANHWEKVMPDTFKVFSTEKVLNDAVTLHKLLDFVGFPMEERLLATGIHLNLSS